MLYWNIFKTPRNIKSGYLRKPRLRTCKSFVCSKTCDKPDTLQKHELFPKSDLQRNPSVEGSSSENRIKFTQFGSNKFDCFPCRDCFVQIQTDRHNWIYLFCHLSTFAISPISIEACDSLFLDKPSPSLTAFLYMNHHPHEQPFLPETSPSRTFYIVTLKVLMNLFKISCWSVA